MGASGTCRDDGHVRAFQAEHDGKIAGNHVDDGAGNEERRYLASAAFIVGVVHLFDQAQAADAGTDGNADTLGVLIRDFDTGIAECLDAGHHAVLYEGVHAARFLGRKVLRHIESFDLTCDLRSEAACIELGDFRDAGFPG